MAVLEMNLASVLVPVAGVAAIMARAEITAAAAAGMKLAAQTVLLEQVATVSLSSPMSLPKNRYS
jgi:hypothetical protein